MAVLGSVSPRTKQLGILVLLLVALSAIVLVNLVPGRTRVEYLRRAEYHPSAAPLSAMIEDFDGARGLEPFLAFESQGESASPLQPSAQGSTPSAWVPRTSTGQGPIANSDASPPAYVPSEDDGASLDSGTEANPPVRVRITGTLALLGIEGGCYALLGTTGECAAVIANPEDYAAELTASTGMTVTITGCEIQGYSVRMAGPEVLVDGITVDGDGPTGELCDPPIQPVERVEADTPGAPSLS